MDVPRQNFYNTLPYMLSLVQNARFVVIDLEMSGITLYNTEPGAPSISPQEAYIQAKKAAELFTIVEVGLTFIRYDEGACKYSTKTFNIPLSPEMPFGQVPHHTAHALTQRLDRTVGISMRSLKFLKENQFDLSGNLNNGCFYLGRHEEEVAKEWVRSLRPSNQSTDTRPSNDTIDLLTLNEEHKSFYTRARLTIQDMLERPNRKGDTTAVIRDRLFKVITYIQMTLIKQLVREEFPQCIVLPQSHPVQEIEVRVAHESPVPEDHGIAEILQQVDYIAGFRYLFEALTGGSFASKIQQYWTRPSQPEHGRYGEFNRKFNMPRCGEILQKNRPIIVGHNLFHDLVFIYRTFFGPLPDDLDSFLAEVHEIFPRIVDTKYMATRKPEGSSNTSYVSLQGLYEEYEANCQFPPFTTKSAYGYPRLYTPNTAQEAKSGREHMAGYDSEMTAKLFCRLGYYLFSKRQHVFPTSEAIYAPPPPKSQAKGPSSLSSGSQSLLDGDDDAPLAEIRGLQLNHPALVASTSKQTEVESMPRENYSPREIHILPLWSNHFWAVYGNKTRVGGAGVVSFM